MLYSGEIFLRSKIYRNKLMNRFPWPKRSLLFCTHLLLSVSPKPPRRCQKPKPPRRCPRRRLTSPCSCPLRLGPPAACPVVRRRVLAPPGSLISCCSANRKKHRHLWALTTGECGRPAPTRPPPVPPPSTTAAPPNAVPCDRAVV